MMRTGFKCLVLIIISLVIADLHAQGSKNILRIRFDTITVKTPTQMVALNVWYRIDGTKPHNFRGFDCRLAYEKYQIAPIDAVELGTACAHASLFHFERDVYPYQGEARLQVLSAGNLELDLTRPVLFRLVFSTYPTLYDTLIKDFRGLMECSYFEVIGSGIDSVVIENGWIQYEPPVVPNPEPPKKWDITVSTASAQVQSDSLVTIALHVSALDSAMLKYGRFLFGFDSTVLAFVDASPGAVLGAGGTVSIESKPGEGRVTFFGADTTQALAGTGELLSLRFRALKREDTVCIAFTDTALFALNDSTLIDTIFYSFAPICVLGQKDLGAVDEEGRLSKFTVLPNPAHDEIRFFSDEMRSGDLVIWNVLGEQMERTAITGTAAIDVRHYVPGAYRAVLMQGGRPVAVRAFVIMH